MEYGALWHCQAGKDTKISPLSALSGTRIQPAPACSKAVLTPALEPLVLLVNLTDLGPRPLGS